MLHIGIKALALALPVSAIIVLAWWYITCIHAFGNIDDHKDRPCYRCYGDEETRL